MEITIDSLEQMCDLMCDNYVQDELHEKIMHIALQLHNSSDKEFVYMLEALIRDRASVGEVLRNVKQEIDTIPLYDIRSIKRDIEYVLRDINDIIDEYIADYEGSDTE